MKNIFIILFISTNLAASPGCIDNSWHMERPFDNKEYHVVTRKIGNAQTYCPCPCRKLSLNRGECLDCHHRHIMPEWIIIRSNKK